MHIPKLSRALVLFLLHGSTFTCFQARETIRTRVLVTEAGMDTFEVLRFQFESHFIGLVCTVFESDVRFDVDGSNRTCHGLICM